MCRQVYQRHLTIRAELVHHYECRLEANYECVSRKLWVNDGAGVVIHHDATDQLFTSKKEVLDCCTGFLPLAATFEQSALRLLMNLESYTQSKHLSDPSHRDRRCRKRSTGTLERRDVKGAFYV